MLDVPADKDGDVLISLTDDQAQDLALGPDLERLGCGQMACAYAANDGRVVKFTKDTRDALASYIISNLPAAGEGWAIPIHAVYRLEDPDDYFVIVAERAQPIDADLANAIDWIYDAAAQHDKPGELLDPETWNRFIGGIRRDINSLPDSEWEARLALREAADAIDRSVRGFHRLGLEWIDFHSGNFGVYNGDVVAIDLGLSFPAGMPPAAVLDRVGVEHI